MGITKTSAKKWVLKKPKYIVATEWGKDAEGADELTNNVYVLETVERDTTTISQDDNETTDVECETSDTPIDSVTTLGKWTVSSQLDDVQPDVVKALCGFFEDKDGNLCAPASYTDKYIQFDVVFADPTDTTGAKYVAARIPKLKMNSKLTFESLNSALGHVTIAGNAEDVDATTTDGKKPTPFMIIKEYDVSGF